MDIQTLKIFVSEQELNELARQNQPPDAPVKNLSVRVTPEGVCVSGEVTLMITMAFESLWRPEVVGGKVAANLVNLTAAGFPATTMLRPLVMGALKDAIKDPAVQVTEEAVVVDVQELVRREKPPVNIRFEVQAVRCVEGGVEAEAGLPPEGASGGLSFAPGERSLLAPAQQKAPPVCRPAGPHFDSAGTCPPRGWGHVFVSLREKGENQSLERR